MIVVGNEGEIRGSQGWMLRMGPPAAVVEVTRDEEGGAGTLLIGPGS